MSESEDIDEILEKVIPVLTLAIKGDYSGRIKMKKGDRLNVVYAGIQALLEIIREQMELIEQHNADLEKIQSKTKRKPKFASFFTQSTIKGLRRDAHGDCTPWSYGP